MSVAAPSTSTRSPWITLCAVLIMIAGFANVVWGLHALGHAASFNQSGLIWTSLSTWGWLAVIFGVIALIGATLLFLNKRAGIYIGVLGAIISATFWLFVLPALPVFSLITISLDVLVIYGLIVGAAELD